MIPLVLYVVFGVCRFSDGVEAETKQIFETKEEAEAVVDVEGREGCSYTIYEARPIIKEGELRDD